MTLGFKNVDKNLVCKGIIGDGCGADRVFFVKNNTLYAFDSITNSSLELLDGLKDIVSIEKKGCIIFLKDKQNNILEFDLSTI